MVAKTYDEALRRLLVHEGGNDDDPRDPGGRTSRGIIQSEWDKWRLSYSGLPPDVWQAPQSQVLAIYRELYWSPLRCDDLPAGVDYAVFDYGVNSGVGRSAKVLQRLVGVGVDGEIGDKTLAYTRVRDPKVLVGAICDERLTFLKGLKTWPVFGRGWSTRVREVRAASLLMAGTAQGVIPSAAPVYTGGELPWMRRLNALMGLYEFPGAQDNPAILAMAKACGGKIARDYKHDSIAWCAMGENYILITCGLPGDDSLWALDFRKYGAKLSGPAVGAIATKTRQPEGGHVCNVVGRTRDGMIVGRGMNQSDMVCDEVFDPSVFQYNWPVAYPMPNVGFEALPIVVPAPKVKREITTLPPPVTTLELNAKGVVPAPSIVKPVATGAGGGGAVAGATWRDWVMAHPWETGAIAVGGAVVAAGIVYSVRQWHKATLDVRQQAPTPGLVPVAA